MGTRVSILRCEVLTTDPIVDADSIATERGSFVARAMVPTKTALCRMRSGKASVVTQDAEAAPTIACETEKPGGGTTDKKAATGRPDVQATAYQHVMPGHVAVQAERSLTGGGWRVSNPPPFSSRPQGSTRFVETFRRRRRRTKILLRAGRSDHVLDVTRTDPSNRFAQSIRKIEEITHSCRSSIWSTAAISSVGRRSLFPRADMITVS